MSKKTTKTLVKVQSFELSRPDQMVQAAGKIKEYIVKNKLSVPIVGRQYVMVEGWQFAGSLMALFPRIVEVKEIGPNKWMAHAEIVNRKTNEVVGSGYAICSKAETKKASFDEYAILSMAQTRAIGKAFRNVIGWIIKLAGYEGTPAEEMGKVGKQQETPQEDMKGKAGTLPATDIDKQRIVKRCKELGAESQRDVASIIKKKTGKDYDWGKMTKAESSDILFKLLQ